MDQPNYIYIYIKKLTTKLKDICAHMIKDGIGVISHLLSCALTSYQNLDLRKCPISPSFQTREEAGTKKKMTVQNEDKKAIKQEKLASKTEKDMHIKVTPEFQWKQFWYH
ncbi:hypothetical protein Peur_044515 [Populus x canadensis]